jgi:hypothetical protein
MRIAAMANHNMSLADFSRWSVEPSGDYEADCATGHRLAWDFLAWRHDAGFAVALGWLVSSIAKRNREGSGIEAGFFHVLGSALMQVDLAKPEPALTVIEGDRK